MHHESLILAKSLNYSLPHYHCKMPVVEVQDWFWSEAYVIETSCYHDILVWLATSVPYLEWTTKLYSSPEQPYTDHRLIYSFGFKNESHVMMFKLTWMI